MASDVMSLFGMNPAMIQQNRLGASIDQASRMSADYAIGAAGGAGLASGINSLFGLQTPEMQQASNMQSALQGVDLNTPAGLRKAAQQLSASGDYGRAMSLTASANKLEADQLSVTQSAEDRALGKLSSVIVREATAANPRTMAEGSPAVTHSIRTYPDGSVLNYTTGKKYASAGEMMEAINGNRITPAGNNDVTHYFSGGKWNEASGSGQDSAGTGVAGSSGGLGVVDSLGASGDSSDSAEEAPRQPDFMRPQINKIEERIEDINNLISETGDSTYLDPILKVAKQELKEAKEQELNVRTKQEADVTESIEAQLEVIKNMAKVNNKGQSVVINSPAVSQARIKLDRLLKQFKMLTDEEYSLEEK
jgi:hypothetical protein